MHNEEIDCVFLEIKEPVSGVEIGGGIDGVLWQRLCGHSRLAGRQSCVPKNTRGENEASVDTAVGRALVGVNDPTFLVLPVVVQRCSYCVSANYPVSCCAADPPHLTPRALSAIFPVSSCPLFLPSSVLPFIMLTTTLVVKLDSVQRPLSLKLGCKGVN